MTKLEWAIFIASSGGYFAGSIHTLWIAVLVIAAAAVAGAFKHAGEP